MTRGYGGGGGVSSGIGGGERGQAERVLSLLRVGLVFWTWAQFFGTFFSCSHGPPCSLDFVLALWVCGPLSGLRVSPRSGIMDSTTLLSQLITDLLTAIFSERPFF